MRLLIIGDLCGQFKAASHIAQSRGVDVRQVTTIDKAMVELRSGYGADLIMMDVKQPIALLVKQLTQERIHATIIACGFDNNTEDAVAAIKAGAKEYLPLPPNEELIAAVLEAITHQSTAFLYQSPIMQRVVNLASRIAASEATVLITGASGTGKEVMARYLHAHSNRAQQPFISVNCAAIPDNLLESELFGHEKGAFTGAVARRIGKFEEAHQGTLLLDEISEMDLRLQAKLLRAIQEREIDRIGGTQPVKLNIRFIATSNRDLRKEVEAGRFREDLYFRLNIINLELPPLRQRKEDVMRLAEHFIQKYASLNHCGVPTLSSAAKEALQHHEWPGNVRELENTLYRAVLLATNGTIEEADLMLPLRTESLPGGGVGGTLVGYTLEKVEKDLITATVHHCLGDYTHAATILGISLRTLQQKLSAYHIPTETLSQS